MSAILVGSAGLAEAAPTAPAAITTPATITAPARNQWSTYYDNYFYSEDTCTARGEDITDVNSPEYIEGVLAYYCYLKSGQSRWSMDIYTD